MDEHPVTREGLTRILQSEPDIEVVAGAATSDVKPAPFQELNPSLVMLDLQLSPHDGFYAIEAIRRINPAIPILVFTNYHGDQDIRRSFLMGAKGYLLKDASPQEIIAAVRTVHAGKKFLSPRITKKAGEMNGHQLSPRELEVLKLVADGLSDKEIASGLGISYATVKVHMKAILSKLKVGNRTQAVKIGKKRGFIRDH